MNALSILFQSANTFVKVGHASEDALILWFNTVWELLHDKF
jgi:hypothetical protein